MGRERLQHVLDRLALAPQWQEHPDQRCWLLERHGFVLRRTTLRFEYVAATAPRPKPSGPLRFRSLVGVGEQQFRDAIAEVTRGSLDSYDRAGGAVAGRKRHAARLYKQLAGLEFSPTWWELAYDPAGEVVGLSMPARAPWPWPYRSPLARATSVLIDAGAPTVRAVTSVENQPMARVFERAGYRNFATRQEFLAQLRHRTPRRRRPDRVEEVR